MKSLPRLLTLACLLAAAVVSAETLTVDPPRAKVEFTLGAVMHTVHGAFRLERATVQFDPATGKCGGEVVIDSGSGATGNETRDGRMKNLVLETGRYPEIAFLPDRFQGSLPAQGSGRVEVHGTLRIHGADHEMTVPVDVQRNGAELQFKARFDVPYVEWGLKNPSTLMLRVDKTVRIELDATARVAP